MPSRRMFDARSDGAGGVSGLSRLVENGERFVETSPAMLSEVLIADQQGPNKEESSGAEPEESTPPGLVVGLPLCLLVNWAFRHVLNQWVHVLAYALIGMLYGLVVLTQGAACILPMLIPVIGFPAAVLMALGRTAARPLVRTVTPEPSPAEPA